MTKKTTLFFDKGTLILNDPPKELSGKHNIQWDNRTRQFRAPAHEYRQIILGLNHFGADVDDQARGYSTIDLPLQNKIEPRKHQKIALQAWMDNDMLGVIALPTGAGKTILAVMLMARVGRPTLVHVPTIDLMQQWHEVLTHYFKRDIGLWGGGYNETHDITVATYDSALLHVQSKGNRFGFVIFDECHHLPGAQFQYTALSNIAPFRLGLTATPERADGKEELLYQLVGDLCYQADIREMTGGTLAPYEVETIQIEMNPDEREEYDRERQTYIDFLKREKISMAGPNGWNLFLWKSSRSKEGRRAYKAYLTQKKLSQAASAKLDVVWELLVKHRKERIIVFTQDNEMAYRIGKKFILPVLTHYTKVKEREAFLSNFRDGSYSVLVTSKVLNEGVDVPEANVAIIVSGSGSVREHVQRLGRILRARPEKQAMLYELISHKTGEQFVNKRRRQHRAYKGPDSL
ncbi:MAG: DEAD/DEAH box helicase [Calditrichia bacterium]